MPCRRAPPPVLPRLSLYAGLGGDPLPLVVLAGGHWLWPGGRAKARRQARRLARRKQGWTLLHHLIKLFFG